MSFARDYFTKLTETVKLLDYGEFDNGIALLDEAWKNSVVHDQGDFIAFDHAALTKNPVGLQRYLVRRAIERTSHEALAKLTCDQFMTRQPTVATPHLLAFDALRLMEDRPSQISVLPVVDEDQICVGLIRVHDIVRSGL